MESGEFKYLFFILKGCANTLVLLRKTTFVKAISFWYSCHSTIFIETDELGASTASENARS